MGAVLIFSVLKCHGLIKKKSSVGFDTLTLDAFEGSLGK